MYYSGKKGSYLDEETNEKSRTSHPILESDEDGDLLVIRKFSF